MFLNYLERLGYTGRIVVVKQNIGDIIRLSDCIIGNSINVKYVEELNNDNVVLEVFILRKLSLSLVMFFINTLVFLITMMNLSLVVTLIQIYCSIFLMELFTERMRFSKQ